MVDERELWACANQLMKQHGWSAWAHAAKRAEELLDAGDLEGNSVFLAIADRIYQLRKLVPESAPH